MFSGFLPHQVARPLCMKFVQVSTRYRHAVSLAQELSSNPSPERVAEIRSILDTYQADAENLL